MSDAQRERDTRYARGEISREEWMKGRDGEPRVAAPPVRRPSASPRSWLWILTAIVLGLVVAVAFLLSASFPPAPPIQTSLSTPRQLSASELAVLNASATQGLAFEANNSLWFPRGPVTLVVYASPPVRHMDFVIQGMVNPTIHVAAGSRITVTVVNMDGDMYHNWALSARGPPFSSMPMMGSGTMMTMSMLGPASSGGYWGQDMSFTAGTGSSWYLCTVAGHASEGMFGSFVAS